MNTVKTAKQLAPHTLKSYRHLLRKAFKTERDMTVPVAERLLAKAQRLKLEAQLGVKASDVPGPGRPRKV